MPELADGAQVEVQGSAAAPYLLKNTGGVYSCTCPAWRNQSTPIERRTCKHLRSYLGNDFETTRVGATAPTRAPAARTNPTDDASPTKAPPLLLAHSWETHQDPAGWLMSEKLDGVRAYWDGTQFITRLGNLYKAPSWFTSGLPNSPLDGELWCGRKLFQKTVSIVRRFDESAAWKEVSYLVFDAPSLDQPFEDRLDAVRDLVHRAKNPHVAAHPHEICRGFEHMKTELDRVELLGGEGLMIRQPGSRYAVGRSQTLLKVKRFKDAEARVLEHLPGAGKHKGRLGALLVELPNGTRFSVGTGFTDAQRENPPALGQVITFRFQELSDGGVPRFPTFVGARHDFDFDSARMESDGARPAGPKSPAKPQSNTAATWQMSSPHTPDARLSFQDSRGATADLTLRARVVTQEITESFPNEEEARSWFEQQSAALSAAGFHANGRSTKVG